MTELKPTDEELASGHIFIKSDVYPDDNRPGVFLWTAKHPASGWSSSGIGASPENCVEKINEIIIAAVKDLPDVEMGPGATVLRNLLNEKPVSAELARLEGPKLGRREPINVDSTLVEAGMFEELAPGVLGYTVDHGEELFVPFVYAVTEGAGDVGRFFDGLPAERTVVVPNVLSSRLAGMLERRGFALEQWDFPDDDERFDSGSTPAWVRRPQS